MPNHSSSEKRVRQTETRRLRNRVSMGHMRNAVKKFRLLVSEGQLDEARALWPSVQTTIDRSCKKGIIHKNHASRNKSRLARLLAHA